MKVDDKAIGYCVIVFFLLFFPALFGTLYYLFEYGHYDLVVMFPDLGILAIDNPVKIRGTQVGRVRAIDRKQEKAMVTLEMYEKVSLRTDYKINERDRGLMGDREIEIVTGMAKDEIDMSQPVQGKFVPGIAENMSMANNLREKTQELAGLVHRFAVGDKQQASLPATFWSVIRAMDRLTRKLDALVVELAPSFEKGVQKMVAVSSKARQTSDTFLGPSQQALQESEELIALLDDVLIRVDQVLAKTDSLTTELNAGSSVLAQAFRSESFIDTLAANLHNLRNELRAIRRKGRLNINFF